MLAIILLKWGKMICTAGFCMKFSMSNSSELFSKIKVAIIETSMSIGNGLLGVLKVLKDRINE